MHSSLAECTRAKGFLQSHQLNFFNLTGQISLCLFSICWVWCATGVIYGTLFIFLTYTLFRHVIQRQSVSFHFYADEMQVLLTLRSSNLCLDEP